MQQHIQIMSEIHAIRSSFWQFKFTTLLWENAILLEMIALDNEKYDKTSARRSIQKTPTSKYLTDVKNFMIHQNMEELPLFSCLFLSRAQIHEISLRVINILYANQFDRLFKNRCVLSLLSPGFRRCAMHCLLMKSKVHAYIINAESYSDIQDASLFWSIILKTNDYKGSTAQRRNIKRQETAMTPPTKNQQKLLYGDDFRKKSPINGKFSTVKQKLESKPSKSNSENIRPSTKHQSRKPGERSQSKDEGSPSEIPDSHNLGVSDLPLIQK